MKNLCIVAANKHKIIYLSNNLNKFFALMGVFVSFYQLIISANIVCLVSIMNI